MPKRPRTTLKRGEIACRNCLRAFKPNPIAVKRGKKDPDKRPKFCTAQCRMEFWRHGSLSLNRIRFYVEQWIREGVESYFHKHRLEMRAEMMRHVESWGYDFITRAIKLEVARRIEGGSADGELSGVSHAVSGEAP